MGRRCGCNSYEEKNEFSSSQEFYDFRKYIKQEIELGNLEEIKYNPSFAKGKSFSGGWYRCVKCGEIWRLLERSTSAIGLWEKVDL